MEISKKIKVLLLHNYYQQPGGEDVVVGEEKKLLEARGHEIRLLSTNNSSIINRWESAKTAINVIYSESWRKRVKQEIISFNPGIVHVHNFFPKLTPSVYFACRDFNIPVVQTLHNFRLVCPNALLFRDGKPCELCLPKIFPWPGIMHACYRKNRLGSAALASMLTLHRLLGTWKNVVSAYVVLTSFAKQKLIAGGLPADRLFIKPNFLFSSSCADKHFGDYCLFVGRLSDEKGVRTLMSAWKKVKKERKLKIVGDGPLCAEVQSFADANSNVEFLGHQSNERVLNLMESAQLLVFPSECYEGFPRTIVEAFAKSLPVVASRIGSAEELIRDRQTGMLFNAGDANDLSKSIEWALSHLSELQKMSVAVRKEFDTKYTDTKNYEQLMQIYDYAMKTSKLRVSNYPN